MIHAGYKTITPVQLANLLWALSERLVTSQAARVYFACCELLAIREAARRYRGRRRETPRESSRYQPGEIARLTGLPLRAVKRALWQLTDAGLLRFAESEIQPGTEPLAGSERILSALACRRSPRRPIPVPRAMLRFLARNERLALTKTIIGYLARGLSLSRQDGDILNRGTAKVSWIARTVGLSERAVSYARAGLIALGWIARDTGSIQRKLNRDGAYFVIRLDWAFVNRGKRAPRIAPLPSEKRAPFAPPIENKKTSNEDQNQKTQEAEPSGVCGKGRDQLPEPSLRHIRREDLHHFGRLEQLYFQAVGRGWFSASEAMALNFIAAAVKAREEGDDPARLFVSLVRRQLWHHLTLAHEDCARRALARQRETNPERFRMPSPGLRQQERANGLPDAARDEGADFPFRDGPRSAPARHHPALEFGMEAPRQIDVLQRVEQQHEGELRRAWAVIAPGERHGFPQAAWKAQSQRMKVGRERLVSNPQEGVQFDRHRVRAIGQAFAAIGFDDEANRQFKGAKAIA